MKFRKLIKEKMSSVVEEMKRIMDGSGESQLRTDSARNRDLIPADR